MGGGGKRGDKFQMDIKKEGVCGDGILPEGVYCPVAQYSKMINVFKIWTIIINKLPCYHRNNC